MSQRIIVVVEKGAIVGAYGDKGHYLVVLDLDTQDADQYKRVRLAQEACERLVRIDALSDLAMVLP